MTSGQSVLVDMLTDDVMSTNFTSSASPTFVSYITNPNDTIDQTDRALFKR